MTGIRAVFESFFRAADEPWMVWRLNKSTQEWTTHGVLPADEARREADEMNEACAQDGTRFWFVALPQGEEPS